MPLTLQLDELGSNETVGVSTSRFDRGVRRGNVKSDGTPNLNTNQGVHQAVQFAIAQAGVEYHQGNTTLPLARVAATRFGPQHIVVTLDYFRRTIGVLTPTNTNLHVARYRGAYASSSMCRSKSSLNPVTGIPTGPVRIYDGLPSDPKAKVFYYPLVRPAVTISVPAILANNPYSLVGARLGSTNLNAVSFGTASFPPNTVRFDSMTVDWIEQTVGGGVQIIWPTEYVFTALNGEWIEQEGFFNVTTGLWDSINVDVYRKNAWSGGFPNN